MSAIPGRKEPGRGRESAWDYPRPPRPEQVSDERCVVFAGETIVETVKAYRVLETSHPPVYYIPPAYARLDFLTPAARQFMRAGAFIAVALALFCAASGLHAEEDTAYWNALRSGGHVALLRHARAPGTGDPPEFALRDCGTQRNLSKEGRDQAARIGARFQENGIDSARVFSSQWCRCLETARLLDLGTIRELPILNSFFRRYERRDPQTQALRDWLARQDVDEPVVLVTHQVNITALTDIYLAEGALVVIRRTESGEISVVGIIESD
jgi:phosphohistidine phosphatase SixA